MTEDINEEDIPSDAFDDSDENLVTCPRTNEEVRESPKAWNFKGFPELTCWKISAKRKMSVEEYRNALFDSEEGKDPAILNGFVSSAGKKFSAGIKLSDDESKWEFYFPPAKQSQHKCPKSGEPVEIREKYFIFKGYPNTKFWKNKSGRDMSVLDYIEIMESGEKGHLFKGFETKKGDKFDSELFLHEGDVKFAYQLEKSKES